jgi:hypothetical protein
VAAKRGTNPPENPLRASERKTPAACPAACPGESREPREPFRASNARSESEELAVPPDGKAASPFSLSPDNRHGPLHAGHPRLALHGFAAEAPSGVVRIDNGPCHCPVEQWPSMPMSKG